MSGHLKVKAVLETKLNELLERAAEIENDLSDPGDSDWGENAIEHENLDTLQGIEKVTLKEIQDIKLALNRIESGKYGICVDCGKPIEKDRLASLPYTSTCVLCSG